MVLQNTLKHAAIRMTGKEVTHLTWVIADFMVMCCSDN